MHLNSTNLAYEQTERKGHSATLNGEASDFTQTLSIKIATYQT